MLATFPWRLVIFEGGQVNIEDGHPSHGKMTTFHEKMTTWG
jgi:hypothetical protein